MKYKIIMGKRISNYEELPFANKKVYDLVLHYTDGNISMFADYIGVSQQVLERIFRKDKRNDKYPKVSDGIKNSLKTKFGFNDVWFVDSSNNAVEVPLENEGTFYTETHNGTKFYELPDGNYRMEVSLVPWCAYGLGKRIIPHGQNSSRTLSRFRGKRRQHGRRDTSQL